MLSNLAPLFAMLGIVAGATLVAALVANIVADLMRSKRLKAERKIWKR